MPNPIFSVEERTESGESIIVLAGECDVSTISYFGDAVREVLDAPVEKVVLDFSNLTFAGACVLSQIDLLRQRFHEHAGTLELRQPSRMLQWMLGHRSRDA